MTIEEGRPLLDRAAALGAQSQGLAVVATTRADGSTQATVVNAGVLEHPLTGQPIVGFVARGAVRKLAILRVRPRATVVFRSGWEWVTVEGDAELVGPDDPLDGFDPAHLLPLLRKIYASAVGGTEGDWVGLAGAMASERHTAVLIRPARIYSNPARPDEGTAPGSG